MARRFCNPSSGTYSATMSSSMPSGTTCLYPLARRTLRCWTPASPTRMQIRRRVLSSTLTTDEQEEGLEETGRAWTAADFEARAAQIYAEYEGRYRRRFKWLRADLFKSSLESELQSDADALQAILTDYGAWDTAKDAKLDAPPLAANGNVPGSKGSGVLPVRRHG